MNSILEKSPIRYAMAILLLTLVLIGNHSLLQSRAAQWRLITPPPPHIEYMSFGFSEVLADSLWLSLIQDFDECELMFKVGPYVQKKCDRGWAFQMLNAITLLAPRFRMPYATGPVVLSILNSDVEGANVIFERAISAFPNDWPILYRAAYHYMFDKKDNKKAAELLLASAKNGGPGWLPALAAKLYTEEGELELSLSTLISLRDGLPEDSRFFNKKQLDEKIDALKKRMAELQLKEQQKQKSQ